MVRRAERSDGMEYKVFIDIDTMERECKRLFDCKIEHGAAEIIYEPFNVAKVAPHITLGVSCILFVVMSFTCYYITHGRVKRAMIQKQRQEYLEYLEEMQDSVPDLRRFNKSSRMAPGYPSLFLSKHYLSTHYKPEDLPCSPSHATLVNRMNKQKMDANKVNETATVIENRSENVDETKLPVNKQLCCCKCNSTIDDTGQNVTMVENGVVTTQTKSTEKTKAKKTKARTASAGSKSSANTENGEKEISKETYYSNTSGNDDAISTSETRKRQKSEVTDSEKDVSEMKNVSKKISAYVKKSYEAQSAGNRKILSYSNNSYIIEVENQTTDNNDEIDFDNDKNSNEAEDSSETTVDVKINVRRKSPKRKDKARKRLHEKTFSTTSSQKDYELRNLVKDAEEIESQFSSDTDKDTLDESNGNTKSEQEFSARFRAVRQRSISDHNMLHLSHPISTLYCPSQLQPPALPTIEISSPSQSFSPKQKQLTRHSTMPFIT